MKIKQYILSTLCISLFSLGCERPPDFPNEPQISFENINKRIVTNNGSKFDSVVVKIYFRDGDGDLGLDDRFTSEPHQQFTTDSAGNQIINENYFNFFLNMYYEIGNQFYKFEFPNDPNGLFGRFPPLSPIDKSGPIEGTLEHGIISISQNIFPKNTRAFFTVYIQDRALNKSNEVHSDTIVLHESLN